MAYANGRLPRSALGEITRAANGDRAYLRKDVARLFLAMNAESVRRFGVTLRATSGRVAYRTYAQQQYFWNEYQAGRGNLAARPGTSNHGLGTTVDFATPQMRAIVDKIGAKYGFAKRWSDAPSEWWHIKCVPSKATYKPKTFKVLKYRSQGSRVKWVQRRLRAKGYKSVEVTGFFGKATVSALKRYQKSKKLDQNGKVGPAMWKLLAK